MEELMNILFKKYGFLLSKDEVSDLLDWFSKNEHSLLSEEEADVEIAKYLSNKYKGRRRGLFEQDNSSLSYILMLLRQETKKTKKK